MSERPDTPQTEHIGPNLVNDQSAHEDALGFAPYVRAMARFLAHRNTTFPLTVSVEGEWGSGKSSFMKQLSLRLQRHGFLTVSFDPWRYDTDDGLWATFALEFIRQLSAQRFVLVRPWLRHRLFWRRFQLGSSAAGRFVSWVVQVIFLLAMTGLLWIWFNFEWPPLWSALSTLAAGRVADSHLLEQVAKLGVLVLALVPVFKEARVLAQSTLEVDLRAYLRHPRYETYQTMIGGFHKDFKQVVDTYSRNKPIVVFVDDLDRCSPDRATDMMQAINLMIADDPRVAFVMAMDREKLAAGYAAKHEKFLPYVNPPPFGREEEQAGLAVAAGIDYGFSFLEKFVTVPFRVPSLGADQVERLMDSLVPWPSPEAARWTFLTRTRTALARLGLTVSRLRLRVVLGMFRGSERWPPDHSAELEDHDFNEFVVSARVNKRRQRVRIELYEDSDTVRQAVVMVAPALGYNPRRIKQFINLLRLHTFIAGETGLFDEVQGGGQKPLTVPQIAKLVAVSLRWPRLIADMYECPQTWAALVNIAYGEVPEAPGLPTVERWKGDEQLIGLIRAGCVNSGGALDPSLLSTYGLAGVAIQTLFQASPQILRRDPFVIKDRPGNGTMGSIDFWRQHKSRMGPIARAMMEHFTVDDGEYSLRLFDQFGNEMWLAGVNAGYSGEGPRGTLTVLLEAGFEDESNLGLLITSKSVFELVR